MSCIQNLNAPYNNGLAKTMENPNPFNHISIMPKIIHIWNSFELHTLDQHHKW